MIWLVDNSLAYVTKNGKYPVHSSEMAIVSSLLKLLKAWFDPYALPENEKEKLPKEIEDLLDNMCLHCTIWSVGAAIEEKSRKGFNLFIRKLITANMDIPEEFNTKLFLKFPFEPRSIRASLPEGSVFDLCYNK